MTSYHDLGVASQLRWKKGKGRKRRKEKRRWEREERKRGEGREVGKGREKGEQMRVKSSLSKFFVKHK
jgi:hypothetical protein